ncbi:hypothetical protein XF24_00031 [candidate division SR1 bacterium Aalborg_AAW-1]|nr:hypothetical protein XF24_00031 [candidate division SR1 bacterium Aalborg_AAW-1]
MLISTSFLIRALITTVLSQVTGVIWFGPLFGKVYAKALSLSQEDMKDSKPSYMAPLFIGEFITKFIIFFFIGFLIEQMMNVGGVLISVGIIISMVYISQFLWSHNKKDIIWLMIGKLIIDLGLAYGVLILMR